MSIYPWLINIFVTYGLFAIFANCYRKVAGNYYLGTIAMLKIHLKIPHFLKLTAKKVLNNCIETLEWVKIQRDIFIFLKQHVSKSSS